MLDKPIKLYRINGARIDWDATSRVVMERAKHAENYEEDIKRRYDYNMRRLRILARKYGTQRIIVAKITGQ